MLTVILAGGKGMRIFEETQFKPKAMVEIAGKPIIEHIIDYYQSQNFDDFLILTGYKANVISEYFKGKQGILSMQCDDKCVTLQLPSMRIRILDTGEDTGSAARLRLAASYITEEKFMLTYCDGLCSVRLEDVLRFHEEHGGLVTLTAVRPKPRYGVLKLGENGKVISMKEKDRRDAPVINGGFMVMERKLLDLLTDEMEQLEKDVLSLMAEKGMLRAYYHDGFWQNMDTMPEKQYLCSLWESGDIPWMIKKEDESNEDIRG